MLDLNHGDALIIREATDQPPQDSDRDVLFQEFWRRYEAKSSNSIPSGLIFLRGEKFGHRGFGWAPKTFLAADSDPFPHPLPRLSPRSLRLRGQWNSEHGLRVRYPGFKLHHENKNGRRKILIMDKAHPFWTFPCYDSILEYYTVTEAAGSSDFPFLAHTMDSNNQLAIILTRSRPTDHRQEIGLLVMIKPDSSIISEDGDLESIYHCEIVKHILVKREVTDLVDSPNKNGGPPSFMPSFSSLLEAQNDLVVGEAISEDQQWYVDGMFPMATERITTRGNLTTSARNQLMELGG